MKSVLKNGAVSGLAAGVAMALFMVFVARGPINDAIDYEDELAHETAGAHHESLFSRGTQEIGGALGLLIFGIALGVIFAIVLAKLAPKLGRVSPVRAAVTLGSVGFVSVVLVPFLKYPANPPAVGDPDTINERTVLYFCVLALSVLFTYLTWRVVQSSQYGPVGRAWLTAGMIFAGLALIFLVLPDSPDEVTAPDNLIWPFRIASIGALATLWTVMSLTMATVLTRDGRVAVAERANPVTTSGQT